MGKETLRQFEQNNPNLAGKDPSKNSGQRIGGIGAAVQRGLQQKSFEASEQRAADEASKEGGELNKTKKRKPISDSGIAPQNIASRNTLLGN